MAQTKQSPTQFGFTFVDLSQETALAVFHAAVQTRQATDKLVQNLVEVGISYQEASARLTKEYASSLHQARQEWMKMATEATEKMLSVSPTSIEYPFKKEVEEFNANIVEGVKRTYELFAGPFSAVTKRA